MNQVQALREALAAILESMSHRPEVHRRLREAILETSSAREAKFGPLSALGHYGSIFGPGKSFRGHFRPWEVILSYFQPWEVKFGPFGHGFQSITFDWCMVVGWCLLPTPQTGHRAAGLELLALSFKKFRPFWLELFALSV